MDNMKPLIEAFYNDCRIEQENHIMRAVADLDIVIDKPRLIKAINDARSFYEEGYAAAEKSLVRHGRWIICSDGYYPYCSECKEEPYRKNNADLPNYCPNCGAKMGKEE